MDTRCTEPQGLWTTHLPLLQQLTTNLLHSGVQIQMTTTDTTSDPSLQSYIALPLRVMRSRCMDASYLLLLVFVCEAFKYHITVT